MIISEYIKRLEELKEVAGDVPVIIQPFYDEAPYEIAAAECISVVEGRTSAGDQVWHDQFPEGHPNVVTLVRVF